MEDSQTIGERYHSPLHGLFKWLFIIISFVIVGLVCYQFGLKNARHDHTLASGKLRNLREQVSAIEKQRDVLIRRVAFLEQSSKIEKEASQASRESLHQLEMKNMEFTEELAFYKNLFDSAEGKKELYIQEFKLKPNGSELDYRFELVLTQTKNKKLLAEGLVDMRVKGGQGEDQTELSLAQIKTGEDNPLAFSFKYYQRLYGEIKLPDGFVPTGISIHVNTKGKGIKPTVVKYVWNEVMKGR